MWISTAFAQEGGGGGGLGAMGQLWLPLILIFVIFYFLLIRPQQKRLKQHREMLSNLRRGDDVVVAGGIIGKISKLTSDSEVEVDVGGSKMRVRRDGITDVVSKTQPASSGTSAQKASKKNKK